MAIRKLVMLSVVIPLLFAFNNCCTTKLKQNDGTQELNKITENKLSTGMVDLTCEVLNTENKNGKLFCLVKIVKVHGYGNSVKALAEEMNYEFEVGNNLREIINKSYLENKDIRCKIIKVPGSMDRTGPDKFKIISVEQN